jgi:hypothetical protein
MRLSDKDSARFERALSDVLVWMAGFRSGWAVEEHSDFIRTDDYPNISALNDLLDRLQKSVLKNEFVKSNPRVLTEDELLERASET